MMGFILQLVGDFAHYRLVRYDIEGRKYEAKLVSQALHKVYANHRVVLLAPESLALKPNRNAGEISKYLKEPKELENRIREEIKRNGLMEEPFEVSVVQSSGIYTTEGSGKHSYARFINHIDNVVLDFFWKLLELGCDKDEVIVDASTGHNIYVTSLLESVRALIVYSKLHGILQGESGMRVRLATVPPVPRDISSSSIALPVNLYEYDVKAFFDFPFKEKIAGCATSFLMDDLSINQKTEVGKALQKQCSHLFKLTDSAKLAFNSLRYNTPLVMFNRKLVNLEESPEKGLTYLKEILAYFEQSRKVSDGPKLISITRWRTNKVQIMNTYFSLALLASIRKFWEDVIKAKPTTKEIECLFIDAYTKAGLRLNARFLVRDLNELEKNSQKLKIGETKLLSCLIESRKGEGKNGTNHAKYSDIKRNFFAHSGLTKEFVKVTREDNNDLMLNYLDDKLKKIKSLLENPEDKRPF